VACSQTSTSDSAGSIPSNAAGAQPPAVSSQPKPATPFVDHPRIIDTQHARIFTEQSAADMAAAPLLSQQWNQAQAKITPLLSDGGTAYPNFTVTTTTPVLGAPSIYAGSFTTPTATDLMFFGTTGSGTISGGVQTPCSLCTSGNFFALDQLHNTPSPAPNVVWSATVSGGTSAASALSANGSQVFVLSDTGYLYCFQALNGHNCSGDGGTWATSQITIASGGAVSPWVDTSNNVVYVNDGNGNLYRFNATTGAQQWKLNYASSGSTSLPVEANFVIYIGDGAGNLYRIVDPGTGSAPSSAPSVAMSGQGTCTGTVALDGSVAIDTRANLVFVVWQGCGYAFPYYCASGCTNTTGSFVASYKGATSSVPDKPFHTWPTLDGTYVYWVMADKPTGNTNVSSVWKANYSFTNNPAGTPLYNASSSVAGASVGSAPLVYGGNLFVGDQSGYVEEFGCASTKANTTSFLAETNAQGGTINSEVVLDDATGNIEFGFTKGTGGGVAQFPLWESSPASNFNWNCPSGYVACDNQLCGTGTTSTACVPTAECSTGGGCTTVAAAGATIQVGVAASEGANVVGTQADSGTGICPNGTLIQGVLGASYGLPPASPDDPVSGNTFQVSTVSGTSPYVCYATDSLSVTETKCPVNSSETCTFDSYDGTFGDPCVGVGKHFYGWFACAAPQDAGALPTFCSRQNVTPTTGSDPCAANPDGGSAATCQGTCTAGWGDCNSNLQYDGCETYISGADTTNCGGCGTVCPTPANAIPKCTAGTCGFTCNTGAGYALCGGACVATTSYQTDPNNCGSCGHVCSIATPSCVSGTCTAVSSALACSTVASVSGASIQVGEALAEGNTVTDTTDGGVNICPTGTVIQAVVGASYGTPPTSDNTAGTTFSALNGNNCYGNDSISTTQSECASNSQSCAFPADNAVFTDPCSGTTKHYYGWFVCAPATDAGTTTTYCSRQNVTPASGSDPCAANPDGGPADCQGTCLTGTANCDGNLQTNGCEIVTAGVDVNNCGACGNVCPVPTNGAAASCSAGVCKFTCNSGYNVCGSQCLPTSDYQTDSNNCGSCGHVCTGAGVCTAGVCGSPTTACSTVAAAGGTIVVGTTPGENQTLTGATCTGGNVIQAVLAASYGTPPASDADAGASTFAFSTGATGCNDDDSLTVTQSECPVNSATSCAFTVSNTTFVTDPCYSINKHYYGWFVCAPEMADAGALPYYCSRQNLLPPSGTDPCTASTDGGAAYCSGTCSTGFGNCDGNLATNGCEADFSTDPNNCGGCGAPCTGSTPYCVGGACAASPY
jgi:hypothetical protein